MLFEDRPHFSDAPGARRIATRLRRAKLAQVDIVDPTTPRLAASKDLENPARRDEATARTSMTRPTLHASWPR